MCFFFSSPLLDFSLSLFISLAISPTSSFAGVLSRLEESLFLAHLHLPEQLQSEEGGKVALDTSTFSTLSLGRAPRRRCAGIERPLLLSDGN